MRRLRSLLAASAGCAIAAAAATPVAHAAVEVTVGPFKMKGGYTGVATLTDAGKRRADVTIVLRRFSATFDQQHRFEPDQTVRIKHNHAFTRGSVTGRFGRLGKMNLTWASKAKEKGTVPPLAGCEGDRGTGTQGTFKGRFMLKTGERYFKKIDVRKTKGAMYENPGQFCGRGDDRDSDAFVRLGDATPFELLAADYESQPTQVISMSQKGKGPLGPYHELTLVLADHSVFRYDDAPNATINGVGPFLSGSATFTAENPNCRSFVRGEVVGNLTVKFDSPGPVKPFEKKQPGSFASQADTTGC